MILGNVRPVGCSLRAWTCEYATSPFAAWGLARMPTPQANLGGARQGSQFKVQRRPRGDRG